MTAQAETPESSAPQSPRSSVGWPEILVGLTGLAVVGMFAPAVLFTFVKFGPVTVGVITAMLSGVAGVAGFAIAATVRVRSLEPFGIRRAAPRWLWSGLAGGAVAIVVKLALVPLIAKALGLATDTQDVYRDGATGGGLAVVLTAIGLVIVTPIGEELLFRGVVLTGLLRYGPVISTVGSAAIFAMFHGINVVLPNAFIVGLITAELRRRSGSVWPGMIVHAVHNSLTVVVYALS